MPIYLRISLKIVLRTNFLSVASYYMTADHRVHEPEAHLGMVFVTVKVLIL